MSRLRRPVLRGHPLRAALVGMVPMLVVAALPPQIRWADTVGTTDPPSTPDRLRMLTVSPTLLYSERSGLAALLVELVWAAVFLGVLLAAAWAVAVRTGDDGASDSPAGASDARASGDAVVSHGAPAGRARPFAVVLAMPAFAPLAGLVGLMATNVGRLSFDPIERGWHLHQLLVDAQGAAAHLLLVSLAGSLVVFVAHADMLLPLGEDGQPQTGRAALLVVMRGPMATLWPRIGTALLAALGGLVALWVLPDLMASASGPFARLWCHGGQAAESCASQLEWPVGTGLTDLSLIIFDDAQANLSQLYAYQSFFLVFAIVYFQIRTQPLLRSHPITTLLTSWLAYTCGVVMYEVITDVFLNVRDQAGLTLLLEVLIPPPGLGYAMLAAPVVAVLFAAVHALVGLARDGVRGRRQSSQPGVTTPAS